MTLMERSKNTKEELNDILKGKKCKICSFLTTDSLLNTMTRHYVMQHFSEALEYFFGEYFFGAKCQKCNSDINKNSQGSIRLGKLVHVGFIHKELHPLLSQGSEKLSQYIYPWCLN